MRVLMVLGLLSIAGNAAAQGNMLAVVERVTAADPARFACAHSGRQCEAEWIKAVAWALNQIDGRWGLNAKRDGPASDLSLDVVTFRVGPTDRHVRAYDICGACGAPSARPVWNDITNDATMGNPGTARWVKPEPVGDPGSGGGGTPTPPQTPPAPDYTAKLDALAAALATLTAKIDTVAAVMVETRDAAKSAEHDAREINAKTAPVVSVPCLTGRVPKAFGGSAEVTLCPPQ